MAYYRVFAFILLGFLYSACSSPVPVTTSEDDSAVEMNKEAYVTRVAISVIGRKPIDSELEYNLKTLDYYGTGTDARNRVVLYFMGQKDFAQNIENMYRQEILEGVGPNIIRQYQVDLDQAITLHHDLPYIDMIEHYYQTLEDLRTQIDHPEYFDGITRVQRLMVDNYIYDQINMGPDNYVLSLFQHIMLRKPTRYELSECKKMLSFSNGILFRRYGKSKKDMLDILFTSDNYYEAQTRYWYKKLLNREPTAEELHIQVYKLKNKTFRMQDLVRDILVSDQFTALAK